ncbi:NAD(P)/FAD-dependent oxidoreductase [Ideonella livida]|uniref:NAD(P)/FAD-dependent oxidoreductase n=1 Tax=Ideonella livida TaxID=2707176 RepID=A0A7C9PJM7_9BURK|nr:FAD-dependent oxidoreductase [Ideonella livida]NDY92730.1 NAD(P)/FAD-dependent oxidoreductase [Ideonella livida]
MTTTRLVIIGNGMAGLRTLEELLPLRPPGLSVTVFGAEDRPAYNRIQLSPVLAGEMDLDEVALRPASWYAEQGVTLHLDQTVVEVDRQHREVRCASGLRAGYDRLVLATGSLPFMPPLPGRELAGVMAYRDVADTQAMIAAAQAYRQAVVIGGGLLGLEAACGLARRGMAVTVVHLAPWLMERQLDRPAGALLAAALGRRGLHFALGAPTEALLGDAAGRVRAVRLKDGRELPASLVVVAAGIRPRTELAQAMGLQCDHGGRGGVRVTDTLQSVTDPRVYAVGECASHRGTAYGLVAPAYEQARVCANHLAGLGVARYPGSQTSTQLKVSGIALFSAGDFMGGEGCEEIVLDDPAAGVYRKLVLREGRLVGACLYGDTQDGPDLLRLIRAGTPVTTGRDALMFDPAGVLAAGTEASGAPPPTRPARLAAGTALDAHQALPA